ncbi:MAG: OmpA family protein, partial [Panacagrimonas sp.]
MASHVWEDSERQMDDGWGGTLAIGKQFSPTFMAEISGSYQEHHVSGESSPFKMSSLGLSALIFPLSNKGGLARNIYGIVGAHYGDAKKHPIGPVGSDLDDKYTTVLGSAGLGFLFGPISWLNGGAFRAEALYRMDFHDEPDLGGANSDDFGDAVANIGFLLPIGPRPQPPAPAEPPPVEVVPAAAPADSDGDGVTDDLDQCPGTPAGEPVNEVGCPLPKKECKTPEPGQPVTLEGCAAGDKIVLRGVNFEYDKSRLTSNAKTILDGVNDALGAAPSVTVELGGHTDARGSDEYNQKLSERRAASVRQYLSGKGVDAGRMTSGGYGEAQPVADNE